MVITEEFVVEVPKVSGLSVGDVVEPNMTVNLRNGYVLGKGFVIRVDNDPAQHLLPVFFVIGLQTHVRSVLHLGALRKSQCGIASYSSVENIKFLNSFGPYLEQDYLKIMCCKQADLAPEIATGEEDRQEG